MSSAFLTTAIGTPYIIPWASWKHHLCLSPLCLLPLQGFTVQLHFKMLKTTECPNLRHRRLIQNCQKAYIPSSYLSSLKIKRSLPSSIEMLTFKQLHNVSQNEEELWVVFFNFYYDYKLWFLLVAENSNKSKVSSRWSSVCRSSTICL